MGPELILGTAQFDTSYGIVRQRNDDVEACQLIELATSLRVKSLDTAPGYGTAEEIIGSCHWPGPIHTKISRGKSARDSLKNSLLKLRRDCVEVAYFHDPSVLRMDADFFEQAHRSVAPHFAKHLGVSVYTPDEFDAALSNPFISAIQAPINVVDPRITDEQLERATLNGKRVFARSIFLQGTLMQDSTSLPGFLSALTPVIGRLEKISSETGHSRMEILVQSVFARPGLSGIVVGAETPEQLVEIAAAFDAPPLSENVATLIQSIRMWDLNITDPRMWPRR